MIRVLIVDDSALVRRLLTQELSQHSDIEVVGSARDPYVAREKILELRPDVVTLDLEMPRMDGLTFLDKLMRHHPLPVVVVSSLTLRNRELAIQALSLGAVQVIRKPGGASSVPHIGQQLVRAVRAAAMARIRPRSDANEKITVHRPRGRPSSRIIALGASTGGTQALEVVLRQFPADAPGTMIVQHLPGGFIRPWADRLNQLCSPEVREARDGDLVAPGVVLIAPGGRHMLLERDGLRYRVRIKQGPPVHYQQPSVDVLFHSVARCAGANAVGGLLTGMGVDGAQGLLAMRRSGARTMAQSERTCVVFGMPQEAVRIEAAETVVPLGYLSRALLNAASEPLKTVEV